MAVKIWDNASNAFKEAGIPMRYDATSDAMVETAGKAYNRNAQAWEEKWSPEKILYFIKDGIPCCAYTWQTIKVTSSGSISSYSEKLLDGYFSISVAGTASEGMNVVFEDAVSRSGVLYLEDAYMSRSTSRDNRVHYGISEVNPNGSFFTYGSETDAIQARFACTLKSEDNSYHADRLELTIGASHPIAIGIYANNYFSFAGTMKVKNFYFVPDK